LEINLSPEPIVMILEDLQEARKVMARRIANLIRERTAEAFIRWPIQRSLQRLLC